MAQKASGKAQRQGISLFELQERFPNEDAARAWFESIFWPEGRRSCMHCGSTDTYETPSGKPQPYRCRDCKQYFSIKTGTAMEGSPLPLLKWLYALFLDVFSLKGVASMKIYRDLKITQKTAWYLQHRIRLAWAGHGPAVLMEGPVEVDESYFGGKRRNMHAAMRRAMKGRGGSGKTAVVGAKDRASNRVAAKVVRKTDQATLQRFVVDNADWQAEIYTDSAAAYKGLPKHNSVAHSAGEYVKGQIHTNGVESFWSMLKRAHKGVFHKISPKQLQRYVDEFAGRHNIRELDTLAQMRFLARGLIGRKLPDEELIAGTPIAATGPCGAAAGSAGVRIIPADSD